MSITHNDDPVSSCELGREEWRESIIRQIVHSKPPKVIGIHGTWGTGKTSLMIQMYGDLGGDYIHKPHWMEHITSVDLKKEKEKYKKDFETKYGRELGDIQPVWFEAWQYQHEPNILAALLKELRDQLSSPRKIWNTVSEETQVLISAAIRSISLKFEMFGANFGLSNVLDNVEKSRKTIEKNRLSEPLDAIMEKRLLKEAIDQLLCLDRLGNRKNNNENQPTRKAVIFIDDLDRCMPETAFRMLESIKIYFNLENCVFVLGMDLQQIEHILIQYHEKQYSQNENKAELLKNLSRLYLEKICQDVYHLPLPTQAQKIRYFKNLLEGKIDIHDSIKKELIDLIKEYNILPPFPRSMKIWANIIISFCCQKHINEFLEKEEVDNRKLKAFLIFTYLYAFHFEVYQLCILYREFYGFFKEYCKNPFSFSMDFKNYEVLTSLKVPIDLSDMNQLAQGQNWKQHESEQLSHLFPARNFRRVLWISKLVKDTRELTNEIFENLKIEKSI